MEIQHIEQRIFEVRGQKVMLDFDLAELYEVETRVLNQAVKRNLDIFPDDFMLRLRADEWEQISSQIVMTYPLKRPKASPPLAFTEHGVTMLANVLRSKKARQTSILIVRAFIALKQFAIGYKQLHVQLKELEDRFDTQFKNVYDAIDYLLKKEQQETDQRERKRIGYRISEEDNKDK